MKALVIAQTAMRRFLRDRTALFFTIALPLLLIIIIGPATAGFDDDEFPVGIVSDGKGELVTGLRRALDRSPRMDLETFDDRAALGKAVRRGVVPAGVVIPKDYDERLLARQPVNVPLLLDQTRGFPIAVRSVIGDIVAEQGAALQAAAFTSERTGKPVADLLPEARVTAELFANVAVGVKAETIGSSDDERDYLPPGIGYQAPSNLILFVFITSLAGSALLIQSRQLRVTQRMFSTPTSARTILAGEGLARLAIAGFQALFIFTVSTLLFGVDWGQPIGAAALIFLFVLVGTSVGMLFGTIFRTPEQAGSIGSMAGIGMGMLGGCMWPLEIVPETMQRLGHVFPHAWAMDAWIELIGRGGTIADIGTELVVLAGWVVVLAPLAVWRLRRTLVSA
ncbi:MAG: ABC transporter permease [Actinomycetota bacterium]